MNYKPKNNPMYTVNYCVQNFLLQKRDEIREFSYRNYRYRLIDFLKWCEQKGLSNSHVNKITVEHAEELKHYLLADKKLLGKTALEYRNTIKQLWGDLLRKKIVDENPFANISIRKNDPVKPAKWTTDYLAMLQEYFSENLAMLTASYLLYYCYIRPKECVSLRIAAINFERSTITIPREISKNGKTQTITMPTHVRDFLLENKIPEREANQYLIIFHNPNLQISTRRGKLNEMFLKFRKHYDIPRCVKFYGLKHTGNYNAYKSGVDIVQLKEQNRHYSIEQTHAYIEHLVADEQKEVFLNMPKSF